MGKYATTKVSEQRYDSKGHGSERPSGKTASKSVNEEGSSGKYFSTSGGFAADTSSQKNPPNPNPNTKEKDKKQENTSEEEIEVIDLAKEIRTGKARIVTNDSTTTTTTTDTDTDTDKSPPKFKAESRSHHHHERHTTGGSFRPKEKPQPPRYAESYPDSFDSNPPAKPASRSHHKPGKAHSSRKSPKPKAKPTSRRPYIESPSDSYSESDHPAKSASRHRHTGKGKARRSGHGSSALPRSFTVPTSHPHTAPYVAPAEYPAAYPEPYSVPTSYSGDYTEEPQRTSGMDSYYSQRGYDPNPRPSSSTYPVTGTSSYPAHPDSPYYDYDYEDRRY